MQTTKKIYNLQSLSFLRGQNLKIGIVGGSFYPAHEGHLSISLQAIKYHNFDYIIWLVAAQNPFKPKYKYDIFERSQQALLLANHPKILVSIAEYELGTYQTFDTLKILTERFSHADFTWIMGIDNLEHFHKWKRSKDIVKLCKILIFDRPFKNRLVNNGLFSLKFKPSLAKNQSDHIMIFREHLIPISSSEIRGRESLYK